MTLGVYKWMGEVVWKDQSGKRFRMAEITDSHMVSIIRMLEWKNQVAIERKGPSVASNPEFRSTSDRIFMFMTELARRGINYGEVPRPRERNQ